MDYFKSVISDLYKENVVEENVATSKATDDSKDQKPIESEEIRNSEPVFKSWFQNAYSQSTEVWGQIKKDMSEAAQAVLTSEPLVAAERTATSVYRQLSDAAHHLQDVGESDPIDNEEPGNDEIEVPVPDIKAAFGDIVSAIEKSFNTIFKIDDEDEEEKTQFTGDNREARIAVLRADPRTFEEEPPMPNLEGVLPYADWRKMHFDEETCCPLGGNSGSPAQVLEESPFVRRLIVKLVNPDANGSLTDGDVWSRYFYHVYLLDLGEARRRKIFAERQASSPSPAKEVTKTSNCEENLVASATPLATTSEEPKAKEIPTAEPIQQPVEETLPEQLVASITTSPASSIVVVDHEDAVLNEQDEEEPPTIESCNEDENDDEWDGPFGGIQLTEDELKDAENELEVNQPSDMSTEINDWETWS